jgi:hypothetical protein
MKMFRVCLFLLFFFPKTRACRTVMVRLDLQFQKVRFKNNDFKMCNLKKQFLKTLLNVRKNRCLAFKNRRLAFKILLFKKSKSLLAI